MLSNKRNIYFIIQPGASCEDFLEGKYACMEPPEEKQYVAREGDIPLRTYAGQYWWVEVRAENRKGGRHKAISTEQIAELLEHGSIVVSMGGPYSSLKEASDRMENYWEAIMGYDDD